MKRTVGHRQSLFASWNIPLFVFNTNECFIGEVKVSEVKAFSDTFYFYSISLNPIQLFYVETSIF